MATNDKKGWKKLKVSSTSQVSNNSDAGSEEKKAKGEQDQSKPAAGHSSKGHATDAKDTTATSTMQPTLRSATTDSSRLPKNEKDERPTGGNVR